MPKPYEKYFGSPGGHLILDPDFNIVDVGDRYAYLTYIRKEDVLGQNIFDIFPDNPNWKGADGVRNLRISLEKVKSLHKVDKMLPQRYDIRKPYPNDSRWVEKWWDPINFPILDDQGNLLYIVHQVEDITDIYITRHFLKVQRLANYILYTFVVLVITVGLWQVSNYASDIHRLSTETCHIQRDQIKTSRGLAHLIQTLVVPITKRNPTVREETQTYLHDVQQLPNQQTC
jgi:hypothetical protein